jgi:fatty-acyl-CoA synthase
MPVAPRTFVQALETIPRREGRGFTFIGADRKRRSYSYEELWQEALRRAAHLHAMGLKKGDRVALVIAEGHEFVLTFFGATVAGIVPVPIFPRATFKAIDGYVDILAHIVEASKARVLVTMEGTKPFVDKLLERNVGLEKVVTCETAFAEAAPEFTRPEIDPDDVCFLQFTSGSTSRPKGVIVKHKNLVANAQAFLGPSGLNRVDADVGVSWLPLFHDMGLIGFILGTIVCDIPVVILPTASFARMPRLWLDTIHEFRGTITYAPNFAYQLVSRRVKDADLARLDLSCIRVAGCGAEPIRASALAEFANKFRSTGFDGDRAYLPSYGMAESTLAITFHDLGTPVVVHRVDAKAMKRGRAEPAKGPDALEIVGCGRPFPGHELAIIDEAGFPLGEREVGEIKVRGPSVTEGYFENEEATNAVWKNGWLHTGDLGYIDGGNLFICGRKKDLLIIKGANHYPQDIEWVIGDLDGVRRGNVVAFSVDRPDGEELVIVAEGNSGDAARLTQTIVQTVMERFGLQAHRVEIVPVGTLPKTSSGKAQRSKAKAMFEEGTLERHGTTGDTVSGETVSGEDDS